jgi:16S rRNA (cytosine967-C5)-methyltransferase
MADVLKGRGRIFAYDVSAKKLQALTRRMTRAGLNNIQTIVLEEGKESEKLAKFKESADLVLVDSPCSGWGVLRRNPDIKWRQDAQSLERMPQIQKRLLQEYSHLVAPGGRLVYGVCSFRQAETTQIVESFLRENSHFDSIEGGYFGPGPCDGFFMQAFVRKAEGNKR